MLAAERSNRPALEGQIAKAAYLGTHMEYTVATALGDFFVVDRTTIAHPLLPGRSAWIGFADHGVTVIPAG
jgi:iron(III) transport system ATP-binding protein